MSQLYRQGQPVRPQDRAVRRAWFALIAPVGLYVVYFTLAYLLGEAGCKLDALQFTLLGVPFVKTATVALGGVALLGVLPLARLAQHVAASDEDAHQFMGRASLMMCLLAVIMLLTTIGFIVAVTPC